MKIIVVGCGGTGSNLIGNLAQLAYSDKGIKEIILIDGDIVEPKNFRNQKFTENDVSEYKSKVLARRYCNLGVNISYMPKYISSEEELINVINKDDIGTILVSCVDNNKARVIFDKVFHSEEIKNLFYIDAGNGTEDRWGQVILGVKSNNKVIAPPISSYFDIYTIEKTDKKSYVCSNIVEHPQNFATNVLSATTIFTMLCNIIEGRRVLNKAIGFNVDKCFIDRYNPVRNEI